MDILNKTKLTNEVHPRSMFLCPSCKEWFNDTDVHCECPVQGYAVKGIAFCDHCGVADTVLIDNVVYTKCCECDTFMSEDEVNWYADDKDMDTGDDAYPYCMGCLPAQSGN